MLDADADPEASTGESREANLDEVAKRIKSKEADGKEKRKSEVGKERRKGEGKRGNDDDEEWTMGESDICLLSYCVPLEGLNCIKAGKKIS